MNETQPSTSGSSNARRTYGKWKNPSYKRCEDEKIVENPPIPKAESEGVAGPASGEMEVDSKTEPKPEVEGVNVDAEPRRKHLEDNPGVLTTTAIEAIQQLREYEPDKIRAKESNPWRTPSSARPTQAWVERYESET